MKRTKKLAVVIGLICGAMLSGCGNKAAESDNGEVNTTINVLDIVGKEDDATNGELIEVDPFERLDVVFLGTAPSGTADIKYVHPADYPMSYKFEIEPRFDLRNGDIVRMYIIDEDAEQIANDNGYTLTATEKEYVVEGLDFYVESLDQITDELQDEMNKSAEEIIEDDINSKMEDVILQSYKFIGNYFFRFEDSVNYCYSIYKVNTTCPAGEVTYYSCVKFGLIRIRYGRDNTFWEGLGTANTFYVDGYRFVGYKTLDELTADCNAVMETGGNYTFESNMTE